MPTMQWNAGLSRETRMSRAEFREMVLEKGLEQLEERLEEVGEVGDFDKATRPATG